MACSEGQEGRLFNPAQCKHDPFEWPGTSQDILVWADLPKQPRGAAFVPPRQIFKLQEQQNSMSLPKRFFFFFKRQPCLSRVFGLFFLFDVILVQAGSQLLERGLFL